MRRLLWRPALAVLLGVLALGGKCRLHREPTAPPVWARLLRVVYTRPAEMVNPAWCGEFNRLVTRTLDFGPNNSYEADEVRLGPPDVYVWDMARRDFRFVEGAWVEMKFTEVCVPHEAPGVGLWCWTGERLAPEVEVPEGYRLEQEVVPFAPCADVGVLRKQSVLRIRIVKE